MSKLSINSHRIPGYSPSGTLLLQKLMKTLNITMRGHNTWTLRIVPTYCLSRRGWIGVFKSTNLSYLFGPIHCSNVIIYLLLFTYLIFPWNQDCSTVLTTSYWPNVNNQIIDKQTKVWSPAQNLYLICEPLYFWNQWALFFFGVTGKSADPYNCSFSLPPFPRPKKNLVKDFAIMTDACSLW